jgi:hypothetical protein
VTIYYGVDVAVTLRFEEEEEARFLGAVCRSLDAERLSENQRAILKRIDYIDVFVRAVAVVWVVVLFAVGFVYAWQQVRS